MREFKPILGLDELKQSRLINIHVTTQDGKEAVITVSAGEQIKAIKEKLLGEAGAKDLPSYKVCCFKLMLYQTPAKVISLFCPSG